MQTPDATSLPVVRVCCMNVYNESFEETRYSLWLSNNTQKTLAFFPKEGSITGMLNYKDDREFGKLEVEIESPKTKKTLAFCPKEGSVTGMLKFGGDGDLQMGDRVQKAENNGFGSEVEIESLNHTPNLDNFREEDTEGVKKKETDGGFVKLGKGGVGIGSPEYILSASDEFLTSNCDIIDDVNNSDADNEDKATGELKREVVKKGQKRLKKEENNGELRTKGLSYETEEITANNIEFQSLGSYVAYSSPKCDFNANIDINDGKHEIMDGVLMKGSKRARKQECSEDMEKAEMGNEAKIESPKVCLSNAFETQSSGIPNCNAVENVDVGSSKAIELSSLSSDIVKNCASNLLVGENHDFHAMHTMKFEKANPFHDALENVNDDANTNNAIKERKTLSPVRAKEVMESSKRMHKEEPHRDLGKMEVDNEFGTPISKLDSDSGAPVETESLGPDYGASSTVEIENVKTNADNEEKEVRAVREKVARKGQEKVKKKEPVKELGKVEADKKTKTKISYLSILGATEFQKSRSDIDEPNSSDMLVIEYPGSYVPPVESEKPNAKTDGSVDMNASKEDNDFGIVSLVGAEVEACNARIADAMVLTGEVEVPKRRKRQKTKILVGGLDIDEPNSSDVLVIENPGSNVVPLVESERPNAETDGSIEMNASKEDNDSGIVSLVGAEVEACDARLADAMVLTGEVEVPKRRKRNKTKIYVGGSDKDAVEKDVRNSLLGEGDIAEVTAMMHEKVGENNALSSRVDAKKVKKKLGKVEVHEKQCSVSFEESRIFLGSIDKKWKNEDIVKLLQDIGVMKIDKVTVIPDPENPKHNRGFAFLNFQTIIDAQTAFSLLEKKSILGNQKIRVEWAKNPDEIKRYKLRREHASWRQPQRSWGAGSADLGYFQNTVAGKRQRSYMLVPCYSDPRWYPRPWTESSYAAVNPSILSPSLGMQSLPCYPLQGSCYQSGLTYEPDSYSNHSQIRGTERSWRERKDQREGAIRSNRDSNRRELQMRNIQQREMYNGSNGGRERFNGGRGYQSDGNGREWLEKWKHDLYEEDNSSLWRERKEPREGAVRSERDSNRQELQIGNFLETEMHIGSNGGSNRFNGGRRYQSGGNGRERVEKWKHDLYEEDTNGPVTENEDEYVARVEALLAS